MPLLQGCGIAEGGGGFNGIYAGAPSITLSGLSGVRAASTISILTSAGTVLDQLTPTYDSSNGDLVFTPSSDLSQGTFTFSFDVVNQESANTPPANALSLQASYLEMPGGAAAVTDDTGNNQPMYVIGPVIEASSDVHQSSDEPCADNTIDVTLRTNVPLYITCTPKITLSGLYSSSSGALSDITNVDLEVDGPTSLGVTTESWDRATGILILAPTVTVESASSPPNDFVVRFTLINPSHYQAAPGMTVGIQYSDAYDFSRNYVSFLSGATGLAADYPMEIRSAIIVSSILQSSPFPCDENTITVFLSADVTLQARCDPQITLEGLTGSVTADGDIDVTVDDGAASSTRTGVWTNAGTLTIGYLDAASTIAANQQVTLSFQVTNPKAAQASPATSLSVSLDDAFHDPSTHADTSMGLYPASNLEGEAWNDRMGSSCPPEVQFCWCTCPLDARV